MHAKVLPPANRSMSLRSLLLGVGLFVTGTASAGFEQGCEREPSVLHYDGHVQNIYASPADGPSERNLVELVFPESLTGVVAERPSGLHIDEVPTPDFATALDDRVFISIDDDTYIGGVYFHTRDGESYYLRILARPGCGNTTVRVVNARANDDDAALGSGEPLTRDRGGLGLIEKMYLGELPRGYRRSVVRGPKSDRLVFRQGPISWYLEETWEGRDDTGYILRVINEGRSAFQIALEQIDVDNRIVRERFGRLREATMLPNDRRLGPAPEYAVDEMHPDHEGLIFLVAEH